MVDSNSALPVVLLEYTSGGITRTYVYGDDMLFFHDGDLGDTRYYYLYDGLGSIRIVMDDSGNVENRYSYEAFGKKLTGAELESNVTNEYLFTGERVDSATNLVYLRARYYDPMTGRFWSMDPYDGTEQDPPSLHKYLYCKNDPINSIDPSGEFEFSLSGMLGSIKIHAQMAAARTYMFVGVTLANARNFIMVNYYYWKMSIENAFRYSWDKVATFDWSRAGHVFRNARGHVNPATQASKERFARLFERVANDPLNFCADAVERGILKLEAVEYGILAYVQNFSNGQVWVHVRPDGIIYDAGVNLIPR